MVWVREDAPVTVCNPFPTTQHQRTDYQNPRLDDEHGDLMSALLARVGRHCNKYFQTDSLTIALSRPSDNDCLRWLTRRNILQP
jgi:hypothetical protein